MEQKFIYFCILSIFVLNFVNSEPGFWSPEDNLNFYNENSLVGSDLVIEKFLTRQVNTGLHDNKTCHDCVAVIQNARKVMTTAEIAIKMGHAYCDKGLFSTKQVCYGIVERMAEPIVFIIHNTTLTVPEFCATLLHPNCMTHLGEKITTKVNWELPLPKRKQFKPIGQGDKPIKMLHLTDIHMDMWYVAGSKSECVQGPCCRSTSTGGNRSAGYWSETRYDCDSPQVFVDNSIIQMAKKHLDIDFVLWTGDNIPHDTWNTTKPINLEHNKRVADAVRKAFKGKLVFPSLGNHETHPIDMYILNAVSVRTNGSVSNNWLYDPMADQYWADWINTEAAKKTFKKGGYYSAMAKPGLKVINLNSNICQNSNYWYTYDGYDPDGQLQWLIDELDAAETNGEYVVIAGHMPVCYCYFAWTNNYIRIAERYAHLIVGTFAGHTHFEEILVFYQKDKNNQVYPVSHTYIGGSMTTLYDLNPSYQIFTINNGTVIDFTTHFTNVTQDNIDGPNLEPKWEIAYSAKDSYKLADLSTKSWDKFITAAKTDDKLTELYFKHYYRYSEAFEEVMEKQHKMTIDYKRSVLQNRRFLNPIYSLPHN